MYWYWYINLTIDGTIYPSQHFLFGAAFVCQAGHVWTHHRTGMGTIRYKEHFKCVKTNNNLGYISNIHKDCFHCHQHSKTNITFQKLPASVTNTVWGFTTWVLFTGIGSWAPSPHLQHEESGYLSNWQLAGNQSGMGDPTSCYIAEGVAFMFTDACKPTHPAKICLQYGGGIMKGVHLILVWTILSSDSIILPKCDGVIQDSTTLWIGFYFVDHVQFAS